MHGDCFFSWDMFCRRGVCPRSWGVERVVQLQRDQQQDHRRNVDFVSEMEPVLQFPDLAARYKIYNDGALTFGTECCVVQALPYM